MGCAVLVKIPSLVMIPLVLVLVWSAGRRRRPGRVLLLLLWLVPVILIAAVWPASAALEGEFDQWMNGVLLQTDRSNQIRLDALQYYTQVALVQGQDPDILTHPAILLTAAVQLFAVDPVLISLGVAGLAFAVVMRNRFLILWVVPVLLFFGSIGWVSWFHLGMLWTAMCIAAAALISGGIERASAGVWGPRGQYTPLLTAAALVAASLGLSTSGVLVHWDATSAYSEAASFTLQNYAYSEAGIIMRLMEESWLIHAYNPDYSGINMDDLYNIQPQKTKKIVMLGSVSVNEPGLHWLETHHGGSNLTASPEADQKRRRAEIHDSGSRVAKFENPPSRPH